MERLRHSLNFGEQLRESLMSTIVHLHDFPCQRLLDQLVGSLCVNDAMNVLNSVLDSSAVDVNTDHELWVELSGNVQRNCASVTPNIQNSLVKKQLSTLTL